MARKKQDIILENVTIESVAAEGKALARIDGTVLFVQFAVPGDIVDVKVTKKKMVLTLLNRNGEILDTIEVLPSK